MIKNDVVYVKKVVAAGLVYSPCLEIGVGYGENNKNLIQSAGLTYYGADMAAGKDVDFVVNFENSLDQIRASLKNTAPYGSLLLLNVLEHSFNPIQLLDNIFPLLRPGGTCIVITPTVWPLHSCPRDYWRINPDFYVDYCAQRKLEILSDSFEYVGRHLVATNRNSDGTFALPSPSAHSWKRLYSRIVHKLFNTDCRGITFPNHVTTGLVIRRPA